MLNVNTTYTIVLPSVSLVEHLYSGAAVWLQIYSVISHSVCLFFCLSVTSVIVSEWLNMSSNLFQHQ